MKYEEVDNMFRANHTVNNDGTTYDNLLCVPLSKDTLDIMIRLSEKNYYDSFRTNSRTYYDFGTSGMLTYNDLFKEYTPKNMTKFKVGDKVVLTAKDDKMMPDSIEARESGGWCKIDKIKDSYYSYSCIRGDGRTIDTHTMPVEKFDSKFRFFTTTSPTPPMGTVSSLVNLGRSLRYGEPEATFRKVGIQDGNGNFTEDAKLAFIENLMQEDAKNDKGYLQTLAAAMKKEQEDSCKK